MRRMLTEKERAELLTTREAAALVGLKVSSFRAYVSSGHGPRRATKQGRYVFYRRADVEAWRKARSAISEPSEAAE